LEIIFVNYGLEFIYKKKISLSKNSKVTKSQSV